MSKKLIKYLTATLMCVISIVWTLLTNDFVWMFMIPAYIIGCVTNKVTTEPVVIEKIVEVPVKSVKIKKVKKTE